MCGCISFKAFECPLNSCDILLLLYEAYLLLKSDGDVIPLKYATILGPRMHCYCLRWSDFKLVNNRATCHSCKIKCLGAVRLEALFDTNGEWLGY